ncbi:MAG: amidohydrolase family protein [Kiritimatiellae bacterium]|nr:amidohydrolase family protein [Kiritimatiellia bacterium]
MKRTALINGTIIDGAGKLPLERGTVIIAGGIIETVGSAADTRVPEDCAAIDLQGGAVLPLLIDGHMHVSREPGRLDHLGHLKTNLQAVGTLQKCLQWGTGTVGHAAGSLESIVLRDLIQADLVAGCADLLVGAAVTATCGHVRGRSADGPWEIRKAVREMIAAGADWIKTCASGGFQHAHEKLTHEDYTLQELQALVDQAHARDKRVHVHAHAQPGLANAIEAGCDVILHGALIDEAALEGIAAKKLWYMPTLNITSEKAWGNKNMPAHMAERMKQASPVHRAGVVKARKMGVRIAVGTDGGPGSIMNELSELVNCGFSPMDAITAATRNTADALGVLDKTGTLEAGKRANLFVVNGNPVQHLSILASQESITLVMKDGKIVKNNAAKIQE